MKKHGSIKLLSIALVVCMLIQLLGSSGMLIAVSAASTSQTGLVDEEMLNIPAGRQAVYTAKLTYANGDNFSLMFGTQELFSIADGTMKIGGTKAEGSYGVGDYTVVAYINPTQQMVIVEVTLPDGGIVRRGASGLLGGTSVSISTNNPDNVVETSIKYKAILASNYELVTTEPTVSGFAANVYNLVSSFSEASSDRLFAWTASAEYIGSDAMAIKYREKGAADWTTVDATRTVENTKVDAEDYFKAEIKDLKANTEYEYMIGKKESSDTENDWSKIYTFTTASQNVGDFQFIAIGDTQGWGWKEHFQYAKAAIDSAMAEVPNAAFILNTGDMVDSGYEAYQWKRYFKALGDYGATIPNFAAIGNHDTRNAKDVVTNDDKNNYFSFYVNHPDAPENAFVMADDVYEGLSASGKVQADNFNETIYSYDYGDAHFVVLHSGTYVNTGNRTYIDDKAFFDAQRAWLERDLQASDATWKIVMLHEATYSPEGTNNTDRLYINDILENCGVDLVIEGHHHLLTRTYPIKNGEIVTKANPDVIEKGSGTVYMTIGATTPSHDNIIGKTIVEEMATAITPDNTQSTYTVVSIEGNDLVLTTKQVNGLVLDSFVIEGEKDTSEVVNNNNVSTHDASLTQYGQDIYSTGASYAPTSNMNINGTISADEGWVRVTPNMADKQVTSTYMNGPSNYGYWSDSYKSKIVPTDSYKVYESLASDYNYYVAQDSQYIYLAFEEFAYSSGEELLGVDANGIGYVGLNSWRYYYFRLGFNPDDYSQQIVLESTGGAPSVKGFAGNDLWDTTTSKSGIVESAAVTTSNYVAPTTKDYIRYTEIKLSKEAIRAAYAAAFPGVDLTDYDFNTIFVGISNRPYAAKVKMNEETQKLEVVQKWNESKQKYENDNTELLRFAHGTVLTEKYAKTIGENTFIPDVIVFGAEKTLTGTCTDGATCSYTLHNVADRYKVGDTTDTYYHSCEVCGAAGASTFRIDANGIIFNEEVDMGRRSLCDVATCTTEETHFRSCSCGCVDTDRTNVFVTAPKLAHDYAEIVLENNLNRVNAATCTIEAIYNTACIDCGDINTAETFVLNNITKVPVVYPEGQRVFYTGANYKVDDEDITIAEWAPLDTDLVRVTPTTLVGIGGSPANQEVGSFVTDTKLVEDHAYAGMFTTYNYYAAKSDTTMYLTFAQKYNYHENGINGNHSLVTWASQSYRIGFNKYDYTQQLVIIAGGYNLSGNDITIGYATADGYTKLYSGKIKDMKEGLQKALEDKVEGDFNLIATTPGSSKGASIGNYVASEDVIHYHNFRFDLEGIKTLWKLCFDEDLKDEDLDAVYTSITHQVYTGGAHRSYAYYGGVIPKETAAAAGVSELYPDLIVFGGHNEVVDEAVAATCTKTGLTEGSHCSVCGEVFVEQTVIDALGHTEVIDEAVAATCTKTGLTEGKHCSVCGEVFVEQTVVPAGHDFDENGDCQRCDRYESWDLEFISNGDGTCYVSGSDKCTDTKVVIPEVSPAGDIVTGIGYRAFYNCTTLTGIEIPATVTSIGDFAFADCTELTSIELPAGVTSIGEGAFFACAKLTSIEIPAGVTNIGDYTFYNCTALTSIEIPAGVTSIGNSAFRGCEKLTGIEIPAGVTSIGDFAFADCAGLTIIEIPAGVTSIGAYTFYACDGLANIELPIALTNIGEYAFAGCTALDSIELPTTVTSIGEGAFMLCGFTSIEIPASVTSLGDGVLAFCYNLDSITVASGNTVYYSEGNCVIETESKTLVAGCKNSVVPSDGSVTSIGKAAFLGCYELKNVEIPSTVISIGDGAFAICGFTSIEIPTSVTSIGDYAFAGCSYIEDILYEGTEEQWSAISKGSDWDYETGTKTADGTYELVCDPCLKGHTEEAIPAVDAECGKTGLTAGVKCSACGDILTEQEETPALEHNYDAVVTPPTATEQGYTTHTCSNCGDSYVDSYVDADITIDNSGSTDEDVATKEELEEIVTNITTNTEANEHNSNAVSTENNVAVENAKTELKEKVEALGAEYKADDVKTEVAVTPKKLTVENGKTTVLVFDVTPQVTVEVSTGKVSVKLDNNDIAKAITFRLPVGNTDAKVAKVYHEGDYFGTYAVKGSGADRYIEVASDNFSEFTAELEDKIATYDALVAALDNNTEVKLDATIECESVMVPAGVTLDLNGNTLKVGSFFSFGNVVDGTEGGYGMIVVANNECVLDPTNTFLPVYDTTGEESGYRFYSFELPILNRAGANENETRFGVRLTFANANAYEVIKSSEDTGLAVGLTLKIEGYKDFVMTYKYSTLLEYVNLMQTTDLTTGTPVMAVTIKGVANLEAGTTINAYTTVASATGVSAIGTGITVSQ